MNTIASIGTDTIAPRYPHLHPDALQRRDDAEAATQQAREDYVGDWLDGDLYDDGETYSAPLQALIDDDGEILGDLLRAYRSKDPAWFDHIAGRVARTLQVLAAMPAAVPGMVLGLAYILTFNSTATPLYLLYGTAALIAIVNFYHYHTQAFLTTMTGFRQLPSAYEEAASSLGAGMGRIAINVVAPFIAPMLISVFFFIFMRSMVTLSAVVFLTTPELNVAAVTIMRLDDAGLTSQAAAFSTCLMAVVMAALLGMKGMLAYYRRKKPFNTAG